MFEILINSIFPQRCIFCNTIVEADSDWGICTRCYKDIPFYTKNILTGNSINQLTYFDGVVCVCHYYGIVRDALVKYKFFNKPSFYRTFAKLIYIKLKNVTNCRNFDIIISVPLHKKRENDRGYNQAYLISKALSRETGIPDKSWLLSRIKNTGNQSLLGKKQRLINVTDAFKINDPKKVMNKSILLVDDILTTGSTVNECSRILKEAGASRIVVAVVASGRK